MECGRLGIGGQRVRRHATEDGSNDLAHAQIPSPNIQEVAVMDKLWIYRIVTNRLALFMVSKVMIQPLNEIIFFILTVKRTNTFASIYILQE